MKYRLYIALGVLLTASLVLGCAGAAAPTEVSLPTPDATAAPVATPTLDDKLDTTPTLAPATPTPAPTPKTIPTLTPTPTAIPTPAPTPTETPTVAEVSFWDDKRGTTFTIGVDASSPRFGHFNFAVSGFGQYLGEVGSSLEVLSSGAMNINYQGPALLVMTGEAAHDPVPVIIVLEGTIGPLRRTATVVVSESEPGRRFQVIVTPPTTNYDQVVDRVNMALLDSDFAALYELMSGAAIGGLSSEEFVRLLEAQLLGEGTIIQIDNLSSPLLESNPAG